MSFLHPYFILTFLILLYYALQEYQGKEVNWRVIYAVSAFQMILLGFRDNVGPDYGSYKGLYDWSFVYDYRAVLSQGVPFNSSPGLGIEWLYILINKIIHDLHWPFFIVTLFVAIVTITLVYSSLRAYSEYPVLLILLGYIPGLLITTGGQMRQAVAGAIMFYGFRYIMQRRLVMFLLMIYLASGFHTSSLVLFPIYWLVTVPLNRMAIFMLVAGSMLLSSLRLYELAAEVLSFVASETSVSQGVNGYLSEEHARLVGPIGLPEIMMTLYACFILYYNDLMEEKSPYYEYFRNITIIGICSYYILRENPILSSRLVGVFMGFAGLIMVNSLSVVPAREKRLMFFGLLALVFFNLGVFLWFGNAEKANYTIDRYNNFILP